MNLISKVLPSIPKRIFGETWTARDSNRSWRKIAISENGQYQIAYTNSLQLYVSNNYGSTWSAKESPRNWSDIKLSFNGEIQVALENNQSSGRIYVSRNFGNTWEEKGPDLSLGEIFNWKYAGISLNGQYIVAVTDDRLFFSLNAGETWIESSNKPWFFNSYGALQGISISRNAQYQTMLAFGDVVISDNYGSTWSTSKLSRRGASQPVVSSNAQIQMLFGKETQFQLYPQINVSGDFGNTWIKKDIHRDWRKLAISADGTRAAGIVGNNQIFVSNNSGNTWVNKFTLPVYSNLFLLEMSSSGKHLIAGNILELFVSNDFGETWALKYSLSAAANTAITDVKISPDGTHASATLTTEKIYTTQRTRVI